MKSGFALFLQKLNQTNVLSLTTVTQSILGLLLLEIRTSLLTERISVSVFTSATNSTHKSADLPLTTKNPDTFIIPNSESIFP